MSYAVDETNFHFGWMLRARPNINNFGVLTVLNYSVTVSEGFVGRVTVPFSQNLGYDLEFKPVFGTPETVFSVDTLHTLSVNSYSITGQASSFLASENPGKLFCEFTGVESPDNPVSYTVGFNLKASILSEGYTSPYQIYIPQVNCADIAISENPGAILDDVLNVSSVSFVAAQSSAYQVDVDSYNFQCFFAERKPAQDVLDEFGKITGVYHWVADSGQLNSKVYQDSQTITDSANIDATITTSDWLSFQLADNPIQSREFTNTLVKAIKVNYDYDFLKNEYQNFLEVNPNNNSLCDSANAAGIKKELIVRTKYIKETDTASFYLANLTRKHTQTPEVIVGALPARFFSLELADVLHVHHPAIVGSESLYQITNLKADYFNGVVNIKAQEILNG